MVNERATVARLSFGLGFVFWPLLYLLAYVALVFYGGRVCPYIDNLNVRAFALDMALLFLLGVAVRLVSWFALRHRTEGYVWAFWLEMALFLGMAVLLTVHNKLRYDFPVGSGVKVGVGFLTVGFFLGLQGYLRRQRDALRAGTGVMIEQIRSSLVARISLILILSIAFATAIIFLVVSKDLNWLAEQPPGAIRYYRGAVLFEVVFVMAVMLALLVHLVLSYARNLRLLFRNQTTILEKVSEGQLDAYVPVLSNDEFGSIAAHTNRMIDGLKEKEKIQSVFGKSFSPRIAQRLLTSDQNLGGEKLHLTLLMSDVRGFTSLAESVPPEELVRQLNQHFSAMVEIIHQNQGEIDKFIGDGILAVFGLTDPLNAATAAVRAGREMIAATATLGLGWRIGVGIHTGEVLAGRIGSSERQEYTFIGDTVNTASRLEAATKRIGRPLVVSETTHDALDPALRGLSWQRKLVAVKGKSEPLVVFALDAI